MKKLESAFTWRRVLAIGAIAAAVAACGPTGMEMLGDAMVDAGERLRDGGDAMAPDARAQECGSNCTGSGVQRVMTADSDPDQLLTGRFAGTGPQELAAGPFVLTDAVSDGFIYTVYIADTGATCDFASPDMGHVVEVDAPATGMHFVVREGQRICARTTGAGIFRWAGFRPYE